MSGEDVYDVAVPLWCDLCQAEHRSCEDADDFDLRTAPDAPVRSGPKAVLLVHINEMHRRPPPKRATLDVLQEWHATQHLRLRLNHFHAGVNLGPGDRPAGWRTGEDAVLR